jgi:pimeloyl-ACP methyl ester carboxylesterase
MKRTQWSTRSCGVKCFFTCLLGMALIWSGTACDDIQEPTGEADIATKTAALKRHGKRDWRFGRIVTEGAFVGVHDEILRYKRYEHIGPDAAYVVFNGGFSGFLEKYEYLFTARNQYPGRGIPNDETLADLPFSFFAFDQVGHGASSGVRSHIDDFDDYVENLKRFIDHIWRLKHHIKPIILMGHSMGGLVAARFAEVYPEYTDALIAISPMWGIQEPAGVPEGMLRGLADFYVAAGLNTLCATPPGVDPVTFAAIAICHQDPTLNACFNDPTLPNCTDLTMCLLQGLPNDCGMPAIDFAGLSALFQSFYTMEPGCQTVPDPEAACTVDGPDFNGGTTDVEYCLWAESHPLAGPPPTFGWISAGYNGIDALMESLAVLEMPTLVLSSPIDPVVLPESHVTVCDALENCTYVPFTSDPDAGLYYFHHLLASSDKATPIAVVREYLEGLFTDE